MIIAVDAYEANIVHRVGIGRYAYNILSGIYSLIKRTGAADVQFRIYLPGHPLPDMPPETDWWRYRVLAPAKLWTLFALPLALAADKPRADVVFSPTHYIPRLTSVPRVMSVMDLSYLYFPGLFRKKDLYKLTEWTKYGITRAKAVLTISEFSKNDIISRYGIRPGKVHVTYPGLSMEDHATTGSGAQLQAKYGISSHYIISVGTVQPRKNYERLIEAFSIFLRTNKQKFGSIDLVIIGKKGWLTESIISAPERFGVEKQVKFLDFVPDSELPDFYRNALCFALPSLYEGFGLPVLEAMAHKIPVVVSDVSSLPEIAGKAGIYVDPEQTQSIADGLLTAVRQRNLLQGKYRIARGLEQVKKFTWETAARQTLEILEKVAGEGKA